MCFLICLWNPLKCAEKFSSKFTSHFIIGVGFGICMISFYVSIYYNTVIAWALYYFFASMSKEVPWKTCDAEWNTDNCVEFVKAAQNRTILRNQTTSGAQEYYKYVTKFGCKLKNIIPRLFLCTEIYFDFPTRKS